MTHRIVIEFSPDCPNANALADTALYGAIQIREDIEAIQPKTKGHIWIKKEGITTIETSSNAEALLLLPSGTLQAIDFDAATGDRISHLLGGYLEAIPNGHGLTVFANEDGLALNLPENRTASLLCERNIVGPVVIAGPPNSAGDLTPLTDAHRELIEKHR